MMKKTVFVFSAVCVAAVIGMILSLALTGEKSGPKEFVPPAFEPTAQEGIPTVTDNSWTQIYKDGMSFSAHICGRVVIENHSAELFFTNDSGNQVWLKLRILDEQNHILAETGLIRPGEYIKTVEFKKVPPKGAKITLKVMAYEPDTYYSAGAVSLNTVVK